MQFSTFASKLNFYLRKHSQKVSFLPNQTKKDFLQSQFGETMIFAHQEISNKLIIHQVVVFHPLNSNTQPCRLLWYKILLLHTLYVDDPNMFKWMRKHKYYTFEFFKWRVELFLLGFLNSTNPGTNTQHSGTDGQLQLSPFF